jgi:hypothetical protein
MDPKGMEKARVENDTTAKPHAQLPRPGAEHRLLNVFIGKWHAKGTSYADGQKANDPLASG